MQLVESGARFVAAADAARRAIERELHDGIQQHLVALGVNLQLAKQLDGTELDAALDQLRADVEAALETVRTLGQRVYPPLLAPRGLAEAMRAAVSVRVEAQSSRRYPEDVEAAVYFSCVAVVESAGAATAVSLRERDDGVEFEVSGSGFDADGLTEVRDRVALLGGELAVEQTRVIGTIPF